MKKLFEIEKLRDELSSLLKASSMRQREIESETGISQGAISNFLSRKRNLNGESALRIKRFIAEATPSIPSEPAKEASNG